MLFKDIRKTSFNRYNIDYINMINKNNVLNKKQFGFRPDHSTYMAVIELVDKVSNAVARNEHTLGMFLTCQKRFIR